VWQQQQIHLGDVLTVAVAESREGCGWTQNLAHAEDALVVVLTVVEAAAVAANSLDAAPLHEQVWMLDLGLAVKMVFDE
jgi:hypothetical protein